MKELVDSVALIAHSLVSVEANTCVHDDPLAIPPSGSLDPIAGHSPKWKPRPNRWRQSIDFSKPGRRQR